MESQEPVFSGPQSNEPLVPFEVRSVAGPDVGKQVDYVTTAKGKPLLLVFVHDVNRPDKIEKAMEADDAVRREIYRIATAVSGGSKLTDYGTPKAQAYLAKWAKASKDKGSSTPRSDEDSKK